MAANSLELSVISDKYVYMYLCIFASLQILGLRRFSKPGLEVYNKIQNK